MLELFTVLLFIWLFVKILRLAFRIAWGTAKVTAVILTSLALPLLLGCLFCAGGLIWLLPLVLLLAAWGILKMCV